MVAARPCIEFTRTAAARQDDYSMQAVDFFSPHALLPVFGWAVATGMGIRQLHLAEDNRVLTVSLIALCILGIIGSWFQGAREHSDARIAEEKQEHIASSVDDMRKSLALGSATPEQVLAAAASKLIQQDTEIATLQADLDKIKNPPGLYDGKTLVGLARGNIKEMGRTVTFQLIVGGENGIDFSKELRYGNHRVSCRVPGPYGSIGSFGVSQMQYPDVQCDILD